MSTGSSSIIDWLFVLNVQDFTPQSSKMQNAIMKVSFFINMKEIIYCYHIKHYPIM